MEFKEFKVEDILKVEHTKSVPAKRNLIDGDIPYVTRTVSNNGYTRYCGNVDKVNKGHCITIGGETGIAFYQPKDFVAGNNMCRLSREGLSENAYLYLVTALNKYQKHYSYSNARTYSKIKEEVITLPVHIVTVPDFDALIDAIGGGASMSDIDTSSWKPFRLGDIIPPHKYKKYPRKPTSEGNIPFISSQSTNNGIACYCGETPEVPKGSITVSTNGNCFDCFYHDTPIIPSSDVEVLYKEGITDNEKIALFLCAVLAPNTTYYSYSNKPKNGKVFDTVILLPCKEEEEIDWDYMERYIAELEEDRVKELEAYLKKLLALMTIS